MGWSGELLKLTSPIRPSSEQNLLLQETSVLALKASDWLGEAQPHHQRSSHFLRPSDGKDCPHLQRYFQGNTPVGVWLDTWTGQPAQANCNHHSDVLHIQVCDSV